ncbi:SGNH/GDSL hydrolase family protein [Rhodococcus aerolatus]
MRRTASLLASAALVAVALAGGTATASAGTTPPTANGASIKTSPYVALGDSYSSAAGVLPQVPGAPAACSRSLLNYPHDIAATTQPASFTDVTCSGARTSDYFTPQTAGQPPQLDAVTKDTRLVTMTIGGNDEGVFVNSFFGCAQLTPTDPTGNPCQRTYGSTFVDTIRNQTYPNLVNALSAVRAKAPRASVVILGYPQILPPVGSAACTAQTSIAIGDVPWLVNQQLVLNDAVRRAAAATGSRYVDTFTQSAGHDACAGPARWMEPLVAPVNAYPVHPNAVGEAKMAEATLAAIGR